nr:MAG TPA: UBA-like domain protein [Caudoviricetes sp.]
MKITDKDVSYVTSMANVPPVVARIALEHSRGCIDIALDYLCDEFCKSRFMREAREFDRD